MRVRAKMEKMMGMRVEKRWPVVEGWDEGDLRSSPVKTRTGREVKARRRYSPSP